MSPEQVVGRQIFAVLQRIKQSLLLTLKDKPVKYSFSSIPEVGIHTKEQHVEILLKIEELDAITTIDDPFVPPIPKEGETYLHIHQPKFEEVCKQFEPLGELDKASGDQNQKKDRDNTPEEKVRREYLWVLDRIKELELRAGGNGSVLKFEFRPMTAGIGMPTKDSQEQIISVLADKGAIEILENVEADWRTNYRGRVELKVLQPQFQKIYDEYSGAPQSDSEVTKSPITEFSANGSIEVAIADLEAIYEETKVETNNQKYYQKLANYGRYLIDTPELQSVQAPLYKEAAQDVTAYKKACDEFWEQWKVCADDIIEKADEAGIKDDPVSPLVSQIYQLKGHLEQKPDYNDDYLSSYYFPYKELIERFEKESKIGLLLGEHVIQVDGNKHIKLHDYYRKARDEWDKFDRLRETRVWWAHYQIMRLTYGLLELEDKNLYFNNDNIIDELYQYEIHRLTSGGSETFLVKKKDFEEWLQRLHKYLIPRLKLYEATKELRENAAREVARVAQSMPRLLNESFVQLKDLAPTLERMKKDLTNIPIPDPSFLRPMQFEASPLMARNPEQIILQEILTEMRREKEEQTEVLSVVKQIGSKISKRWAAGEIRKLKKTRNFGKKETRFITLLADLEPRGMKELARDIPSKDCKHLKSEVQKKLNGSGWYIETTKSSGYSSDSYYQLKFLPDTAS